MRCYIILFFGSIIFNAQAQNAASSTLDSKIADSLYALGNYTKAINYYARSRSESSNLQIARAYNAIGNFEKAVTQYKNVISEDPSSQIARFELGKIQLKLKDADNAKNLFVELTEIDPVNTEYFYYLGKSLQFLKNDFMANKAFRLSLKIDSTHLRSIFELGKYYVAEREKDSVLAYVDKGLEFYANDVALINLKALALFNNEQYAQALPLFERLVALGEKKEFIYTKLAYCYFRTWNFEKAKVAYQEVLKINDGNADAYFNLGQVFEKDRQIDSAQYYFEESIAVQKPFLARQYDALARIARGKKDIKTAYDYYKLAHQEDPDNAMIYFNVCTTADQLYKDAKTKLGYYEKFLEKFGKNERYMSEMSEKRISELKEEIHFAKN